MLKVKVITSMRKLAPKRLLGLALGVTFVVSTFFGVHLIMNMDSQGAMQNCPLLGHAGTVCTMTVTEHIVKWQQLFIATVPSNKFLFEALLFISFVFVAFAFQFSPFNQLSFQTFRNKAGPPEYSSGFLLQALGRGILRKKE